MQRSQAAWSRPVSADVGDPGIWPLEGGLTEYLTYRLKPGRYALFDVWNDEHTGHCHAQDGAVAVVTVK